MNKIMDLIRSIDTFDIMIISLVVFMVASLIVSLYFIIQNKKNVHIIHRKKRKGFLIKSYRVFTHFSITKRYIEQMRRRYEMLCPEDEQSLMCKAMGTSYLIWGISVVILIGMFGMKPSLLSAALVVLTVVVLNHEILEYKVDDMDTKLMNQMDKFLSDSRHSFYKHGMIDEAIEDAAEMSGRIMKVNAAKMQTVLDCNDKDSAIRIYNETVSNRFLRMFLSVAIYVSEFGDKMVNGISVFIQNVHTLKSDIYIELMNKKDTNYKFSGMIFITLAPVYFLNIIKNWSMDISPNMISFYNGTIGAILVIVIYVSTVIMYVMINELKDRNAVGIREHYLIKKLSYMKFINRILSNYEEKNRKKFERMEDILYRVGETLTAKQFFLKRLVYGFALFIVCIIVSTSMHKNNRDIIINSNLFINNVDGVITEKYLEASMEVVLQYTNKYKSVDMKRSEVEIKLRKEGVFRSEVIFTAVVDEIMLRVSEYKKEYFHWYELIFSIVAAGVAYWFLYLMLLYRRNVLKLNMGNEVAQFQSTIMIVMHLNNTTVLKVLELMESFSVIFKESIKNCINDYSSGDLDALEKLKIRERYEPFRRLVDNLIIADKIGIQKAFDEVAEERKVSQEMRNQEYRIARDKKVIYGMIMSYVPAFITVAFYWIIPFAMNALADLGEYDAIMNNLK